MLPACVILLALVIAAAAGLTDYTLFMPEQPFDALMSTAIAGASATSFILAMLRAA